METVSPDTSPPRDGSYEPPALSELGSIAALTLNFDGCYWGKQLGGTDGWTFMGVPVPISNCS